LNQQWVAHDIRDQIVDFVRKWSEKTEVAICRFIEWLKIAASKFYDWRNRYGKVNEHNAWIPRDHWLEDWEKQAIIDFHHENPLEGYRRLTFIVTRRDNLLLHSHDIFQRDSHFRFNNDLYSGRRWDRDTGLCRQNRVSLLQKSKWSARQRSPGGSRV
jgi:hypothetical protein